MALPAPHAASNTTRMVVTAQIAAVIRLAAPITFCETSERGSASWRAICRWLSPAITEVLNCEPTVK